MGVPVQLAGSVGTRRSPLVSVFPTIPVSNGKEVHMKMQLEGRSPRGRPWLRTVGGLLTATLLLGVPAVALSFADLHPFSATSAVEGSSSTTEAAVSRDLVQAPLVNQKSEALLNDWAYTDHDD